MITLTPMTDEDKIAPALKISRIEDSSGRSDDYEPPTHAAGNQWYRMAHHLNAERC